MNLKSLEDTQVGYAQAPIMCGGAEAALGGDQGPRGAAKGPWDPTNQGSWETNDQGSWELRAPFEDLWKLGDRKAIFGAHRETFFYNILPVWTKIMDYVLGAKKFCIFALGAEAAFY